MDKMTKCNACGEDIAKGAKICPKCGKDQRNFFMKHKIITAIVVIVVLGGIGSAMGGGSKSGSSTASTAQTSSSNTSTTKPITNSNEQPKVQALQVTAQQMLEVYKANEVKGDATYKGKLVDVTGVVDSVGVTLGQTYVTLSDGDEYAVQTVQCFIKKEDAEIAKAGDLQKGKTITIEGTVDGLSLNVGVNDCVIK